MFSKKGTVFFLLAFFVLIGFIWWKVSNKSVSEENKKRKYVVIARGEGIDEISRKLYREGLIRSGIAFKIKVIVMKQAKNIQAGAYYLSSSMDLGTIVKNLTVGSYDEWVTVPEGLRIEEVAEILAERLPIDREKFIEVVGDYEGYLFPDTYLIPKDFNEEQIFYTMRDNFDKKIIGALGEDARGREFDGFSFRGVIILASLVEREARFEKDRSIVAGILIKRLKNDWPLQVDAAVQYLVANEKCQGEAGCDWWPKIDKKDLAIDSLYNTYKYNSLPAGPICNPGLSAILSVIDHDETDYWYYLSDKKGKMHYAVELSDHEKNIERYLTK